MINKKDDKPISKVTYSKILGGKEKYSIPQEFIPTKRFPATIGTIFLLVIILSLFQLPYEQLISGNIDVSIEIGYPFAFLKLSLSNAEEFPLNVVWLTVDLFIYIILAYAIDIIIKLILNNPLKKGKGEIILFKDKSPSIAEKMVEKVIKPQKNLAVPRDNKNTITNSAKLNNMPIQKNKTKSQTFQNKI